MFILRVGKGKHQVLDLPLLCALAPEGMTSHCIYGGVPYDPPEGAICRVLVETPGRGGEGGGGASICPTSMPEFSLLQHSRLHM
jgi:hypothetical protein